MTRSHSRPSLSKRQADMSTQTPIVQMSDSDPLGAVQKVLQFPNIGSSSPSWANQQYDQIVQSSDGDEAQVPWFGDFSFTQTANVPQGSNGGWSKLPGEFTGFTLKDDLIVTNQTVNVDGQNKSVVQPYYTTNENATQVKRVIIALPGKPRDSWKYANLFYNARNYVYTQNKYGGLKEGDVMILAPAVLNLQDQGAGGVEQHWIAYNSSLWQMGGVSHYPNLTHSVSFYSVLDKMVSKVMNRTDYPLVNQVVIAGHSMGGQAAVRYAVLKRQKKYDANMRFWIGNPGSWPWLENGTRPNDNPQQPCPDQAQKDRWPYGLGNLTSIPKYARANLTENVEAYVQRFLTKQVHYALGLLDNGAGDTHCQAQYQGANHLQRGSNFAALVGKLNNNQWPKSHSLGYVAGVSHQDYPMIAATESLDFLFGPEINMPRNDTFGLPKQHHEKKPKKPKTSEPPTDYHKVHIFQAVAWVVLAAIIVALIIGFFVIDRIFTPNTNDWDRDYWESDFKRRLL